MVKYAIISAGELGDRWDAPFHIRRKHNEERTRELEAKMTKEEAIKIAVDLLKNIPLKYRRDINPLVRSGGTRAPDIQAQERAVREYPYLAIALFEKSAEDVAAHYDEEADKARAAGDLFRNIGKDN